MEEQGSSCSNDSCSAGSYPDHTHALNGIGDSHFQPRSLDDGGYPSKEKEMSVYQSEGLGNTLYPDKALEKTAYPSKDHGNGMYSGKDIGNSVYGGKDIDDSCYPSEGGGNNLYRGKDMEGSKDSGNETYPIKNAIFSESELHRTTDHPAGEGSDGIYPSDDRDKGVYLSKADGSSLYPTKDSKPKPDGSNASTPEGATPSKPPTPFRRQNRIDFPTIACKICGDRSSGVHYGIISCEGCKGFFRRCLRRKKEYICPKGGKCEISRHQRNRCPSCRYKKCIELGMSKEAVRIGRIPNKQKETEFVDIEPYVVEDIKDLEDSEILKEVVIDEDTAKIIRTAGEAHKNTAKSYPEFNDYLSGKYKRRDLDDGPETDSTFVEEAIRCMDGRSLWSNVISEALAIYIKRIVTFCKQITGFTSLSQHDQMILVKAGFFEILTVQDTVELNLYNAFLLDKGLKVSKSVMKKFMPPELQVALYQFADRLHGRLKLNQTELALLSAIVLFSDDRENLNDQEAVAKMQTKYLHALQMQLLKNHRKDSLMFAKVLLTLPILRTVDDLHNQFIMQLKIGVGDSNNIPMPQLYKEVYDLPTKTSTSSGASCSGDHGTPSLLNGKLPSTSQVKPKEETKEYSSCQRSGGSSSSASPAASVHSHHPGGSSPYFPMDSMLGGHHSDSHSSSSNFEHFSPEMSFRNHLAMAMRPGGSPGPCRQPPYGGMPYKHNSHSGAFRHQLPVDENPGGSGCNHMSPSPGGHHQPPGGHHQPPWNPEMERDFRILSRTIKKEAPDYDGSCL